MIRPSCVTFTATALSPYRWPAQRGTRRAIVRGSTFEEGAEIPSGGRDDRTEAVRQRCNTLIHAVCARLLKEQVFN